MDASQKTPFRHFARLILISIILLGFWLRCSQLDKTSLWLDEILTQRTILRSFASMFAHVVERDVHPPLFYMFAFVGHSLWGESDFAARLPAAYFGVMLIPVGFLLGKRLWGAIIGFLGALMIAIDPFFVFYARDARMYSMAMVWVFLSFYWMYRASETNERSAWIAYAITTLAGFYTHYLATLVLVMASVSMSVFLFVSAHMARKPQQKNDYFKRFHRLTVSFGMSVLLFLPWIPIFLMQRRAIPASTLESLSQFVHNQIQIIQIALIDFGRRQPVPNRWLVPLALVGLMYLFYRKRWRLFILAGGSLLGILVAMPLIIVPESLFPHRISLLIGPLFLLLTAGIAFVDWILRLVVTRPIVRFILIAMVLIGVENPSLAYLYDRQTEDWRGLAAYMRRQGLQSSIVIADGVLYKGGGDALRVQQALSYYLSKDAILLAADGTLLDHLWKIRAQNTPVVGVIWHHGELRSAESCSHAINVTDFSNLRLITLQSPTDSIVENSTQIIEAILCMQPFQRPKLDLHIALTKLYLAQEDPEKSAPHLAVVKAVSPTDYAILIKQTVQNRRDMLLAQAKYDAAHGNMINADRIFQQLFEKSSLPEEQLRILMAWGIAHRFYGSLDRASNLFLQAIAIDPTYTEARANYAATLFQQQRYAESLSEFRIVLSEAPDHFWAYYYSGLNYAALYQTEKARAMLEQAASLASDEPMQRMVEKALQDLD